MNPRPIEKKPTSSWRYEEGVLTIRHLDQKISLGRYATREYAAKAAAAYLATCSARRVKK